MVNRSVAPPIVDAVHFNLQLPPYQKYVLKNGVEVYAIEAGTEDVLQAEWVFEAGNWHETKNLQAALTNHLIKSGTARRTAFEIEEYFDYYGAYLNHHCQSETATISLHCLTKHFSTLLPAIKDLLTDAIYPEEELLLAAKNMQQKLEVNLRKSSFVAGRLIDTYLFGEQHPYGRFSRHEDFDKITRDDLLAFYNTYYHNGRFKLFIAGHLPKHLETLLNEYFGDMPNTPVQEIQHRIQPARQHTHHVVNDDKNNQASIRIARPFFNRHHPDFLPAQVLNIVLGGFFGSRLMVNIREDKGYTYGIHSYLLNNKHENAWMISTEAGRDVSQQTIQETYKEMRRLCTEPVNEEELLLVKNYMMGSILGDLDGPFHIIGRWKNIILNDLPDDFFSQSINNIKHIQPKALLETANKYLNPEDFYELTVI